MTLTCPHVWTRSNRYRSGYAVYLLQEEHPSWGLIVARKRTDGRWWKLVLTRKQVRMNREVLDALHLTTLELVEAHQLDSYKRLAGER